ncbi:unnamed protein product [Jaminaea pallidilutea]
MATQQQQPTTDAMADKQRPEAAVEGGAAGAGSSSSSSRPPTSPIVSSRPSPLLPASPYVLVSTSSGHNHWRTVDEHTPLLPPSMAQQRIDDADAEDVPVQGRSTVLPRSSNHHSMTSQLRRRRSRPRFWYLLPLIAFIDITVEIAVGAPLIAHLRDHGRGTPGGGHRPGHGHPKGSPWESGRAVSLVATILGVALMRATTVSVVGIGNKTDQLGLIIAGVCALSALVLVSVFNLLFQSGVLLHRSDDQMLHTTMISAAQWWTPSLTLLTSIGLVFTVFEYVLYVLVVGIRVPPGGGGIGRMQQVRRWKRGLRETAAAQEEGDEQDWIVAITETDRPPVSRGASSNTRKSRSRQGSVRGLSSKNSSAVSRLSEVAQISRATFGRVASHDDAEGRRQSVSGSEGGSDADGEERRESEDEDEGGTRGEEEQEQDRDLEANVDADAGIDAHGDALSEEEEAREDHDPDDIMDIPLPSSSSRDASRFRLALSMADEPERRRSRTSSVFSGTGLKSSQQLASPPTEEMIHEIFVEEAVKRSQGPFSPGRATPQREPSAANSAKAKKKRKQSGTTASRLNQALPPLPSAWTDDLRLSPSMALGPNSRSSSRSSSRSGADVADPNASSSSRKAKGRAQPAAEVPIRRTRTSAAPESSDRRERQVVANVPHADAQSARLEPSSSRRKKPTSSAMMASLSTSPLGTRPEEERKRWSYTQLEPTSTPVAATMPPAASAATAESASTAQQPTQRQQQRQQSVEKSRSSTLLPSLGSMRRSQSSSQQTMEPPASSTTLTGSNSGAHLSAGIRASGKKFRNALTGGGGGGGGGEAGSRRFFGGGGANSSSNRDGRSQRVFDD